MNSFSSVSSLLTCQVGKGFGLGHLTRVVYLAKILRDVGVKVHLLIQGDELRTKILDEIPHQFIGFNESFVAAVLKLAKTTSYDLMVFDLHEKLIPLDFLGMLSKLRNHGIKLVAIDGLADYHSALDLIFIPSFQFEVPKSCVDIEKFVFGWDSFLLNVEDKYANWQCGKKVLVLTGGSDATGLGNTWPSELNKKLKKSCEVDWVTGPFSELPIWPQSPRIKMNNHLAPSNLDCLMANTNYAVTIFGVSFFELLYYGIPTVVFSPYGDKDKKNLEIIKEKNLALVADDEHDSIVKLNLLINDQELARNISSKALKQMSMRGGQKFLNKINKLLER